MGNTQKVLFPYSLSPLHNEISLRYVWSYCWIFCSRLTLNKPDYLQKSLLDFVDLDKNLSKVVEFRFLLVLLLRVRCIPHLLKIVPHNLVARFKSSLLPISDSLSWQSVSLSLSFNFFVLSRYLAILFASFQSISVAPTLYWLMVETLAAISGLVLTAMYKSFPMILIHLNPKIMI